jgi:hypothetical protein
MLYIMGRQRHIDEEAKPTTVYLTLRQQIAFHELQVSRLKSGSPKPTLTEVMLEGFRLILSREGTSGTELERVFPELTRAKGTKTKIQVISRRRKR